MRKYGCSIFSVECSSYMFFYSLDDRVKSVHIVYLLTQLQPLLLAFRTSEWTSGKWVHENWEKQERTNIFKTTNCKKKKPPSRAEFGISLYIYIFVCVYFVLSDNIKCYMQYILTVYNVHAELLIVHLTESKRIELYRKRVVYFPLSAVCFQTLVRFTSLTFASLRWCVTMTVSTSYTFRRDLLWHQNMPHFQNYILYAFCFIT